MKPSCTHMLACLESVTNIIEKMNDTNVRKNANMRSILNITYGKSIKNNHNEKPIKKK